MLYHIPMFFRSVSHHIDYDDIFPMDPQAGCVLSHILNKSGEKKGSMFSIYLERYIFTLFFHLLSFVSFNPLFFHPLCSDSTETGELVCGISL